MKFIKLRNKKPVLPIMQGGMGVGVSRSSLAGAVAKEGGIGIISTAQIGYDEPDFETDTADCNLRAIEKHIRLAKEKANGNGLVGVNVMHALQHYKDHVMTAARAGADLIVCGAGLATDLPDLVVGTDAAIAPIVSSRKASELIVRMWQKKYNRIPDLIVIEGPLAGGHLGFKREQLDELDTLDYDAEIRSILEYVRTFGKENGCYIPVFVGGGIMNQEDADHIFSLGADGIQVATRFVATWECDASPNYKQAYVNAKKEDITIIKSPVGMPGRALNNAFIKRTLTEPVSIRKCFRCIKNCNPTQIPYCITKALIDAVNGDVENGLVFCGGRVDEIHEITTVRNVIDELLSLGAYKNTQPAQMAAGF